MNFRKATQLETPEIIALWRVVFGDSDDYIRCFIAHFEIENCYVCEINTKIVAMAFALPTKLQSHSNFQKFKYLYACATHPDFQSQGIMKKLLETVYKEACKENYAGVFLQAINQSLAEYYQKLGFEAFFFREQSFYYNQYKKRGSLLVAPCELSEKSLCSLRLKLISPENYYKKRTEKLKNQCFIDWDEDFFQFLNETGTQFYEYGSTFFSFKTSTNNIIVDELLGDAPHKQIATLLFKELPDYEVVGIRSVGNGFCCGQVKWCFQAKNHPKNGWLGFAME